MIQFDVMEGDFTVSHVCVNDDDVVVTRCRSGMLYPFSNDKKKVTAAEVQAFLASRVFPPTRDHVQDALLTLGLRKYDVLDILMQTKGKLPTDNLSVVITERD